MNKEKKDRTKYDEDHFECTSVSFLPIYVISIIFFSILIIVCVATTKERTMTGPLDRLFGNGPFDLDRNGKIDAGETAFINEILFSDEESTDVDE